MKNELTEKFKTLADNYGFLTKETQDRTSLYAQNTDGQWTKWISYSPELDLISTHGNTDHLNIWLYETRKDFTPEKCIQFITDLNTLFELADPDCFRMSELIDPEDWQALADVRDAHKDERYLYGGLHNVRKWVEDLDQIDRDCVFQYEYLLGRQLKDYAEYHEIDSKVDEMILEWNDSSAFFEVYPELLAYANTKPVHPFSDLKSELQNEIDAMYQEQQALEVDGEMDWNEKLDRRIKELEQGIADKELLLKMIEIGQVDYHGYYCEIIQIEDGTAYLQHANSDLHFELPFTALLTEASIIEPSTEQILRSISDQLNIAENRSPSATNSGSKDHTPDR